MAIRVENGAAVNFGNAGGSVTITHVRLRFGTQNLIVKALTTQRILSTGDPMVFAQGDIDLVFPSGDFEDAGLQAVLTLYFNQQVLIDAMTDASTVVAVACYSQQMTNDWDYSTEAD